MRLAEILTLLKTEPLLASNDYRSVLLDLFNDHISMDRADFTAKRSGSARSGQELQVEQPEVLDNGLAVIPVGGPMGCKLGEFEKGAGCVDMNDLARELRDAEENDNVLAICLNIDSPGGTVTGTFELCRTIKNCSKPIVAYITGKGCSGAYAIACACDAIFAAPSANVGNIGVYTVHQDLSELARQKGIKVKVFSSGPYKGAGVPGTSLTPEQEMFIKNDIMEKAKIFQSHVQDTRPQIDTEDMGGQFYSGDTAEAKGFIDYQCDSIDGVIQQLVEDGDILEE